MRLQRLEVVGFKSFAKKSDLLFTAPISAVVGPNGSGKSNVAEAIRFVLGEQSVKSMRGKRGEDLIWNGSEKVGRLNHAKVTIVFDNTDGAFNIDFQEVSISREVFRDNSNQYYINGSQVRLKDVIELLASVHIGASSHHIISQGEADRILNASPKERKLMIEDALGLKIYHLRITEAIRKLEKTEENSKEVDLLRREIAPHLRYLKKQVEKIEQGKILKVELGQMYQEYLKREEVFLGEELRRITGIREKISGEKSTLEEELAALESKVGQDLSQLPEESAKLQVENELKRIREEKTRLNREIGKVEGMIEYESKKLERESGGNVHQATPPIPFEKVERSMESAFGVLETIEKEGDIVRVRELAGEAKQQLRGFLDRWKGSEKDEQKPQQSDTLSEELRGTLEKLREAFDAVLVQEEQSIKEVRELMGKIEEARGQERAAERELYEKKARLGQLLTRLESIRSEEMRHSSLKTRFDEEVQDAVSVLGREANAFQSYEVGADEVMGEERGVQEKRRRDIERVRVRLEDTGYDSGEDVLKEFKEVSERDHFLESELADLSKSRESLQELIADLEVKLETEFSEGVAKINGEFGKFFTLMFGGGKADLRVIAAEKRKKQTDEEEASEDIPPEDEKPETGIDVVVALPGKKTRGLVMLSGGERALTSIALLFAISRVNPPPFMILDETDAALDEANSRKYGDMLENLSEHSQLIVITHNRETMSRAGVLYGITVGSDAVSRLLSVKFDEAVAVAK